MKTRHMAVVIAVLILASAVAAAAADPPDRLNADVGDAIQMLRASNHGALQHLFDTAYGYAIFPAVGKGAVGIGGAGGRGEVYEKGVMVGFAELTQVTLGAQLGGQSYVEAIFFETPKALDEFKEGKTALSADASAVVAAEGAGGEAKYQHGVLVCTTERSGLMFEASIGGQHFKFWPTVAGNPSPTAAQAAPSGSTAPAATPPPASTPPPPAQ
ncbi:MAG TPA: YSC84-related protein [Verrucomicrobiae bacterium]|nr:YSC84-related protein [Verrucomicrobiae bacterium]